MPQTRSCFPIFVTIIGLAALGVACAAPTGVPSPGQPSGQGTPTPAGHPAVPPSPSPVTAPSLPTSSASGAPTPAALATPSSVPGSTPVPPEASAAIEAAKNDLSSRTGTPVGDIRVVSVSSVEWPDSSLGCPKPGMAYSQIITPGYHITLAAGGNEYEYHTDRGRNVVLCSQR